MKFNFKVQQYQTDAVESIVEAFKGQPYSDPVNFRRDVGKDTKVNAYSQHIGICIWRISLFLQNIHQEQKLKYE